jgi:heat shock protein HtpX
LFFFLIGGAIDYLYFDTLTAMGAAFPVATVFALGFAAFTTLTAYYGGPDIILSSLGAEKLNTPLPEQRELQNVVTEMALASGSPMPRIYVIFDPAPNALATGTHVNAAICVCGLLTLLIARRPGRGRARPSHIRNEDILLMTLVSIPPRRHRDLADQSRFYSS